MVSPLREDSLLFTSGKEMLSPCGWSFLAITGPLFTTVAAFVIFLHYLSSFTDFPSAYSAFSANWFIGKPIPFGCIIFDTSATHSFINKLSDSSFSSKSSEHLQSQTVRARELRLWENVHITPLSSVMCHMSRVPCHMWRITCHMSFFFFFFFFFFFTNWWS